MIHVFQQEAALEGFAFVGVPWVSVGMQDVHQFAFPEQGELLPSWHCNKIVCGSVLLFKHALFC